MKHLTYGFENIISKKPKRSIFSSRTHNHLTTFDTGEVIPIFVDEIQPGDTYTINTAAIIRQSTLIKPIMDTAYIDIATYWVPMRIIWEDTKKFFGENTDPWAVSVEPTIPQTTAPAEGWAEGTIADYMNIRTGTPNLSVSSLQFRAYTKIIEDWFRDQNLQTAPHINYGSSTTTGSNGSNYITDLEKGGKPFIANKYHDYYTSCLPSPQKGPQATIPIGNLAEVHTKPTRFNVAADSGITFNSQSPETGLHYLGAKSPSAGAPMQLAISNDPISGNPESNYFNFDNLYADLSKTTGISINELRNYITIQQMLEKDGRSGTRYVEFLKSHFGVTSPDATQQRSEFLGGTHEPLNIQQIPQTAASESTSPQANLAAFSQTNFKHKTPTKTFTEHGYIITIACVRYKHTYQQGIEKQFMRKDRNDFHDPIFSNIGEQPIYNYEIFAQGSNVDTQIFGYNEAWVDYRIKQNRVTGKMRSSANSLDVYHYADYYQSLPTLSAEWIQEDKTNIDRTLAIKSTGENAEPQFQAGFTIEIKAERPLPTYSIPGLTKI